MKRNEEKLNFYGEIYKVTIINPDHKYYNHYYIGQHKGDIFKDYYYGSGIKLLRYIKKYGTKTLKREILAYAKDEQELSDLESKYITNKLLNDPLCLNIKTGGIKHFNHSERTKELISIKIKNKYKDDILYKIKIHDKRIGHNISDKVKENFNKWNESHRLNKNIILKIHNLLINTKLTYKEIAKQCNCFYMSVIRINYGERNKLDGYIYPLRKKQVHKNKKGEK